MMRAFMTTDDMPWALSSMRCPRQYEALDTQCSIQKMSGSICRASG
jgi:hypothetical protein